MNVLSLLFVISDIGTHHGAMSSHWF